MRSARRAAVETGVRERLSRRSARGPPLDAEHDDLARLRPAQRVAETPDRRVVLEDEEPRHRARPSSQSASKRLSHGRSTTSRPMPTLVEQLGGSQRLVQHHRAVGEEDGVRAFAHDAGHDRARARRRDRSAGERGRSRAGSRRSRPPPRPPSAARHASLPRCPAARPSCREARRGARCRGSTGATCPGPAGISPA